MQLVLQLNLELVQAALEKLFARILGCGDHCNVLGILHQQRVQQVVIAAEFPVHGDDLFRIAGKAEAESGRDLRGIGVGKLYLHVGQLSRRPDPLAVFLITEVQGHGLIVGIHVREERDPEMHARFGKHADRAEQRVLHNIGITELSGKE